MNRRPTTVEDLQAKHLILYKQLRNRGKRNKFLISLLMIPCAIYAYAEAGGEFGFLYISDAILVIFLIYLVFALILYSTNTMSFVENKKTDKYKKDYKQDLFYVVTRQIPELEAFDHKQKLHPAIIVKSGLFPKDYEDYDGDDYLIGRYQNVKFEICELYISKLVKVYFHGLFIRISYNDDLKNNLAGIQDHPRVREFKEKYNSKIDLADHNSTVHLAIHLKGDHFECNKPRAIDHADEDIELLKDTVGIIRLVVDRHLS